MGWTLTLANEDTISVPDLPTGEGSSPLQTKRNSLVRPAMPRRLGPDTPCKFVACGVPRPCVCPSVCLAARTSLLGRIRVRPPGTAQSAALGSRALRSPSRALSPNPLPCFAAPQHLLHREAFACLVPSAPPLTCCQHCPVPSTCWGMSNCHGGREKRGASERLPEKAERLSRRCTKS